MQSVHIEDSIDDLISLLNFQKTSTNALKETTNIPTDHEALELGNFLNSPFIKAQQNKAPPRNLSAHSDKAGTKTTGVGLKLQDKVQMKSDLISRNFFNRTTTHSDSSERNKESNENKIEQENVNWTLHPKVSTANSIRYLKFEPLLKDIKQRPKTPPDHGYYFKFNLSDVKLIRNLLEENGFRETNKSNSFSILWSTGPIKNEVYQYLGYYQKVNHFPRSQEITRKDAMHRNIARMQLAHGLKNFNFIPKSFILPNEAPLLVSDAEKNKGTWYIVKPQASSQGRGIYITDDVHEILSKQNNQIIVSQYINDPFLINDLKFDLRVYVAVTSVNPLRIYIYKEGLARFATVPYTKEMNKYANRFIHLTNYSINKKSEAFVQNDDAEDEESCSKWSFATFKAHLESLGIDHKAIFKNIEDIVVKTILSIESVLFTANVTQVPQRHNCFELFGFDILLDSKLKPWLLEVNLSPSLGCESALDLKIKSELLSDLFNMAGVAPLDQRTYYESSFFGKNQNVLSYGGTAPNFDKKPQSNAELKSMDNLTKEEKAVIRETNEEWERRGNFKRIFPSGNVLDYKNYFESDRPYNALLRNVICNNMKKPTKKPEIPRQPINPKKFC